MRWEERQKKKKMRPEEGHEGDDGCWAPASGPPAGKAEAGPGIGLTSFRPGQGRAVEALAAGAGLQPPASETGHGEQAAVAARCAGLPCSRAFPARQQHHWGQIPSKQPSASAPPLLLLSSLPLLLSSLPLLLSSASPPLLLSSRPPPCIANHASALAAPAAGRGTAGLRPPRHAIRASSLALPRPSRRRSRTASQLARLRVCLDLLGPQRQCPPLRCARGPEKLAAAGMILLAGPRLESFILMAHQRQTAPTRSSDNRLSPLKTLFLCPQKT